MAAPVTSHHADSLARMLTAVLLAMLIGTLVAFRGWFSGPVEREAVAAAMPQSAMAAPAAAGAAERSERYVPMNKKTASLLLYSVLRSGSGR